jgi:hypothetical protein
MAKTSKKSKAAKKERRERRFLPQATTSKNVVKAVFGAGAAAMGAGTWAQFGHGLMESELPPYAFGPWLIGAGAVACGLAVWLGTSGERPLRVGAGGIGVESGGGQIIRTPWYGVDRIGWDPDTSTLSGRGEDEMGGKTSLTLSPRSHPAAVGWIVKEGRDRIPDKVDVPEEASGLPEAWAGDGQVLVMEEVQVVGRRCAKTDRIIAYEPDARVCPRCERVYYKLEVPDECECGGSLQGMRAAAE